MLIAPIGTPEAATRTVGGCLQLSEIVSRSGSPWVGLPVVAVSRRTLLKITPMIIGIDGDIGALFQTVEEVVSSSTKWYRGRGDEDAQHHTVCYIRNVDLYRGGIFALLRLRFRPLRGGEQKD